jgi:hypothetical protein
MHFNLIQTTCKLAPNACKGLLGLQTAVEAKFEDAGQLASLPVQDAFWGPTSCLNLQSVRLWRVMKHVGNLYGAAVPPSLSQQPKERSGTKIMLSIEAAALGGK